MDTLRSRQTSEALRSRQTSEALRSMQTPSEALRTRQTSGLPEEQVEQWSPVEQADQ